MISVDSLRHLRSAAGEALLQEACALPGDTLTRLTRLRKRWPAEVCAAAVELLELRDRAAGKFSRADRMLLTRQALEQATGEAAAAWRARRFPPGAAVLDLCCGLGGDAIALAGRGPVLAVDRDPAVALCAKANGATYGVSAALAVACADVERLRICGDAAFFDPSRRRDGRRVRSSAQYSPSLAFVREIAARIPNVAVKVSPALDDRELEAVGGRVEFVSECGECKEAVIWLGDVGPIARRSASVLPAHAVLEASLNSERPATSDPVQWLYEPDPAVIRAHLIPEVARVHGAAQLDPQIAYLTSAELVRSPFATAYRVLDWMPFSARRVEERLRALGRRVVAIKRRGVPLEPEALASRLVGAGDAPAVVVLTRVRAAPVAIICEPPNRES